MPGFCLDAFVKYLPTISRLSCALRNACVGSVTHMMMVLGGGTSRQCVGCEGLCPGECVDDTREGAERASLVLLLLFLYFSTMRTAFPLPSTFPQERWSKQVAPNLEGFDLDLLSL